MTPRLTNPLPDCDAFATAYTDTIMTVSGRLDVPTSCSSATPAQTAPGDDPPGNGIDISTAQATTNT